MDGEEVGNEGRAFAHAEGGISWELASLGKFSWENAVANPATGRTTVVVGTDDTTPLGQVYVYVGDEEGDRKPGRARRPDRRHALRDQGPRHAQRAHQHGHSVRHGVHRRQPGRRDEQDGRPAAGGQRRGRVTGWFRPEDAAWDPKRPERTSTS